MVDGMRSRKLWIGISAGLILICIGYCMVFFACVSSEDLQEETYKFVLCHVPSGAIDIKSIGDGWVEFTYAGHRYLFCYIGSGPSTAASAMTRIDW